MSQPPPDLPANLKKLDPQLLSKKLDNIEGHCQEEWDPIKLYWYTDHSMTHSRRVILRIADILKPIYDDPLAKEAKEYPESKKLNAGELFVLLAGCYSHDIGMQYLIEANKYDVERLTPKQFKEIRKNHPQFSGKHIEEKLKDKLENYTELVRDIAKAHGTEIFKKALTDGSLKDDINLGSYRIRPRLLAALLMMGDELDLQGERVNKCLRISLGKSATIPAESLVHIFKHHYISQVRIIGQAHQPYILDIHVHFKFPNNSEGYAVDLKNWVWYKLRNQCQKTEAILSQFLGLSWGKVCIIDEGPGGVVEPFPEIAMPHLKKVTLERRLVNREGLLEDLKKCIEESSPGGDIMVVYGEEKADQENLLEWLKAAAACEPELQQIVYLDLAHASADLKSMIISETTPLLRPTGRGLLLIMLPPGLGKQLNNWLWKYHFPEVVAPGKQNACVVFMAGTPATAPDGKITRHPFPLSRFAVDQLSEHLTNKLGFPTGEAKKLAIALDPQDQPAGQLIQTLQLQKPKWAQVLQDGCP